MEAVDALSICALACTAETVSKLLMLHCGLPVLQQMPPPSPMVPFHPTPFL